MVPETNQKKLPDLLSKYVKIFVKYKYVGKIKMELQKNYLTSELPISLRAYRTYPKEEAEIKESVKNLFEASLIKECSSPYSAPVS